MILLGDCLERLKELPDNSVDSVVTDPPYGLSAAKNSGKRSRGGFMGKRWDIDVPSVEIWQEVLRVLKPGGHLLSFGGTRTYHRLVVAVEDAGFEIRDQLQWLFGSGFPKSHNIAIGIDKQANVMGPRGRSIPTAGRGERVDLQDAPSGWTEPNEHAPITDAAKQWQGWGTALKPANEPIVLARKPLSESTVAKNVLKWGVGGLNIDASRIEGAKRSPEFKAPQSVGMFDRASKGNQSLTDWDYTQGRWPANLMLGCDCGARANCVAPSDAMSNPRGPGDTGHYSDCPISILDRQSGVSKSTGGRTVKRSGKYLEGKVSAPGQSTNDDPGFGDVGGASRFFKVIKQDQYDSIDTCENVESATVTSEKSACDIALVDVPALLPLNAVDKNQSKSLSAHCAPNDLSTTPAIEQTEKTCSAQNPVTQNIDSANLNRSAKSVENLADCIATGIAQSIAATRPDLIQELLHGLGFMDDSKNFIQTQSPVLTAGKPASTDIIPTTPNYSKLFGSALHAIAYTTTETASGMANGEGQTRFRYIAKSSKRERNAGLEGMALKTKGAVDGSKVDNTNKGPTNALRPDNATKSQNHHPTVKPIKLMEYLIKLVTPPGGTVLDPFMGSGSTGVAAFKNNFKFIGIEMNEEYVAIAEKRIKRAEGI